MEDASIYRRVSLRDYMIEQRSGADRGKQIDLLSKIYSGELKAFTTVPSATPPTNGSMASVLRHAMSEVNNELEVSALSIRKIKDEIGKAAAGREADFQVIDNLILLVPDTSISTQTKPIKPIPREETHKMNILSAIKELGYDPLRLPQPDGKDGAKKKVMGHVREAIPSGAFAKAWQSLRNEGSIRNA